MTLLQEIQRDAVEGKTDIATLLRKCRVLAARLKNDNLKAWVQHELDGYPEDAPLPDYRVSHAQSLGTFFGPFGSGGKNIPIPIGCIPEKYHGQVSTVKYREGVSALNTIAGRAGGKTLQQHWPADLVAIVGDGIYQDMTLVQAWKVISPATISGILDTVRNRVLNFVLELEAQDPSAGEASSSTPLSVEKVQNVFTTNIMGNVTNLATGSSGVQQVAVTSIQKGDLKSLGEFLRSQGLGQSDVKELQDALAKEPAPNGQKFGKRVAGWVGKMITKAAEGALSMSTSVGADVLSKAIKKYYGLE